MLINGFIKRFLEAFAQPEMVGVGRREPLVDDRYTNPVLPGMNSDPSVLTVDGGLPPGSFQLYVFEGAK